jgi:hypothetical protein
MDEFEERARKMFGRDDETLPGHISHLHLAFKPLSNSLQISKNISPINARSMPRHCYRITGLPWYQPTL